MISKHAIALIGELEISLTMLEVCTREEYTLEQYKQALYNYSKAHKELKEYVESLERLVGEAK